MAAEIVIVMGYNAAGKSTLVKEFTNQGYFRLNRDEMGGTLDGQAHHAARHVQTGQSVVLDNTYADQKSRASIIAAAKQFKVPIHCVWLNTSFEDAQLNACMRMVKEFGRLLMPGEWQEPNFFGPVAMFSYRKRFQKPTTDEGFSTVTVREFKRNWPKNHKNKAIILDFDDTLRTSLGPNPWPEDVSHVKLLPGRKEVLERYQKQGYLLLGASNQSAVAKGLKIETAKACYDQTLKLLGIDFEYMFCPHKIPPVSCWCRKPQPGIPAFFIHKYNLLPSECIFVGDQKSDQTCAVRVGIPFVYADKFFFK